MGMNKMEFQWRLNWWYRPTQLDGFGTSVADYYDCFCDWKAIMKLNGCPADEADYVEAFIQNLKPDIRLRLESKGISRMRRLSDVLSDAKFEESMIFLEETIKKFKAKFEAPLEAHNPFDKVPSLVSVDNQEHSSDDEVLEESEELSGLEDDDNDSSTAYETSIDEIEEEEIDEMLVKLEDNPVKDVSSNADDKVFDELPKPALTTTTSYKLLDDDFNVYSELNSQTGATFDQVLGSSGDEARKLLNKATGIQLMKVEGSFLTKQTDLKIDKKVFDEMPRLFFVEAKEKINGGMDSITPIDCVPRVFDPGSVTTKNVYKSESSIKEREGKFTPPLMPSSISLKDIGAAVTLNTPLQNLGMKDELSQPSVIATAGSKFFSGKSYSIFDPGISISFYMHNELFNKMLQPSFIEPTCSESISGQCHSFATFLGLRKTVLSFTSTDVAFIFDPGGYGELKGIFGVQSESRNCVNEPSTLGIGGVEFTHQLIDKLPQLLGVAINQGRRYADRGYVSPLSPLFDYVPQIFDPGGVSWNILGGIIDRNGVNRNFDITLSKLDGELLLFTFDPGGSAWTANGCDAFDFGNDWPHHDIIFTPQVFDPGIRSWILSRVSVNSFAMPIHSNAELWVEGMVFLFDPGGCVSKSSIRLSLIPIMVSAVFRNDGLAADEMAKQPLAQCSQASIVFLKWQIIGLSETEMDCYTFIIIVEHFVWDPGTTLVIVPFTSLRTMMLLRGMEEYSGHGSGRIDVQNGTHKVLSKLSGLVLKERLIGIECSIAAHYMLYVRREISSLDSDEGLDALICEEYN